MGNLAQSPGARLNHWWERLQPLPGGKWLFSRLFGFVVPYSDSMHATVLVMRPGYSEVQLRDRRQVRNHLNCVHAVALINLGELASGLALLSALPGNVRGIVTQLRAQYIKKARGTLIAQCQCTPPTVIENLDYEIITNIHDAQGELVAQVTALWRLGLIE